MCIESKVEEVEKVERACSKTFSTYWQQICIRSKETDISTAFEVKKSYNDVINKFIAFKFKH